VKLAWAFNPFDENPRLQRKALALLGSVRRGGSLETVYVASPAEIGLAAAFDVPEAERFGEYPKRLVEVAMRRLGVRGAKVTVLTQRELSLSASARVLADYLARRRPDLTLVASHARKGVPRLFLGSFAESFVHVSKTNLLVFNERSRIARPAKALLFAHDLSTECDRGLRSAMKYARGWRCQLHVIHVPDPAYGFEFRVRDGRVEAFRKRVRQQVRAIEARIGRARLEGSVEIAPEWHPIPELILERARQVRADLVVVAAKSGRFASLMGGSVTRRLLRAAPLPVLVIEG
jgi:nucleotide-binding universal stress UspA family protein